MAWGRGAADRAELANRFREAAALQRREQGSAEEMYLQLLLAVTTAANEAVDLQAALPLALEHVRAHTGWPIGHAYLVDSGDVLISTDIWSTDDNGEFSRLRERTVALRFPAGVGLPGRVLASGRAVAITDVGADRSFLRADVAVELGVRAAFAFPLRTGSEIIGVLEFFSRRAIELDVSFLQVMEHVGTQLGRVLDRQRARQAAEQARAQAEQAAAMRDDMIRMVSHDLRNPLHAIGLAAGLLEEVELDEPRRRRQVQLIRRSVHHMRRLVEDLIDVERIEAGLGVKVEPQPVDPRRILDDVCALTEPTSEAQSVRLLRREPATLPPIMADHERVLQVLWNLVSNAVKFTPAGGAVTISAEPRADTVSFSVSDSGPGIQPENVDKLFTPYWQAQKAAHLGTGLGLAISKAIVESHGGEIWVEPARERGSTFSFTLPRATPSA